MLERALRERASEPRISQPRRRGEPIAAGTPVEEIWRGRRRRLKSRDPQARKRWQVERTNSWLRAWRRVDTRWERRPELWLAVIQVAAAITIFKMLDSLR